MKWLERGGQGAAIGTAILPGWGTAIGGGVGAIEGLFEGWWMRDKEGKQRRWQDSELLRKYAAIEKAGALETSSSQEAINRQLGVSQQNLASTMSVSGGIRTGNYQRKVGELNRYATEDVARIAQQKALDVEAMKIGYGANVNQFNLELAKLESAKASGDAEMAGVAGQNLAPFLADLIGKIGGGGGETTTTNAGWQSPMEQGGLEGGNPDPYYYQSPAGASDPSMDHIRSLYNPKPKTKGVGGFAPITDNTDPVSVLWGS
jgi:hypothetical protein